jgi:hypothetical protein
MSDFTEQFKLLKNEENLDKTIKASIFKDLFDALQLA